MSGDKRKRKLVTEERSTQEAMKLMVDNVNAALMDKIQEEEWEEEVIRNFGKKRAEGVRHDGCSGLWGGRGWRITRG